MRSADLSSFTRAEQQFHATRRISDSTRPGGKPPGAKWLPGRNSGQDNRGDGLAGKPGHVADPAVRESRNQLFAGVFENALECIVVLTPAGRILEANQALAKLIGVPGETLRGASIDDFFTWDGAAFDKIVSKAMSSESFSGPVQLNAAVARTIGAGDAFYNGSLTALRSVGDTSLNLIATFTDVTQIEDTRRKLHKQALHDNLTGLPNRRFFKEQIESLISSSGESGTGFGICFLDLDDFKVVNDTLGHDAGDEILNLVSDRIKSCIYRDCFLARFGGDEFALLVPRVGNPDRINEVAGRIVDALNEPFRVGENHIYIGVSIGIASFSEKDINADVILNQADIAMYVAKDEGKNTVRQFTPELEATIEARQNMLNELRKAIACNGFSLAYQPKVCLESGRVCGCEALARWKCDGEWISPAEFIEVAERSGLILPLGDQILQLAIRQARIWRESGVFTECIAINLSPQQLADPDFVGRFREMLKQAGASADWFELEITENVMMENIETSIDRLNQLMESGASIAIDDFGTGYSSLNYLTTFPVSTLKIDLSFVRDLPHDRRAVTVAHTILSLGRGLGMGVVAEGIETVEQLDCLKDAGCDTGQGYLFSKPLDPVSFEQWLAR